MFSSKSALVKYKTHYANFNNLLCSIKDLTKNMSSKIVVDKSKTDTDVLIYNVQQST